MADSDQKPSSDAGSPADTANATTGVNNEDDAAEETITTAAQDVAMEVVEGGAAASASPGAVLPKKKRLCRYPGCIRVIKSQGHCKSHRERE